MSTKEDDLVKKRGRKSKQAKHEVKSTSRSKKIKNKINKTITGSEIHTNLILFLPVHSSDLKDNKDIFNDESLFIQKKDVIEVPAERDTIIFDNIKVNTFNTIKPKESYFSSGNFSYIQRGKWPRKVNIRCWWCTYPFDTVPCGIPFSYNSDITEYKVFGCFCGFNCAFGYLLSHIEDKKWEKTSLLHLLYKDIHGKYEPIDPAFPKEVLIDYGGTMTIEEFRNESSKQKVSCGLVVPPIVSVDPQIERRNIEGSINHMGRKTFNDISRLDSQKTKHGIAHNSFVKNFIKGK